MLKALNFYFWFSDQERQLGSCGSFFKLFFFFRSEPYFFRKIHFEHSKVGVDKKIVCEPICTVTAFIFYVFGKILFLNAKGDYLDFFHISPN